MFINQLLNWTASEPKWNVNCFIDADEVLSSKAIQNEPKTYAQFFKSDNFGSSINFVSSSATNTGRTTNTANTLNSRSQPPRAGPIRGLYYQKIAILSGWTIEYIIFFLFRTKIEQRQPVQWQPPIVLGQRTTPRNWGWAEGDVRPVWHGDWSANPFEAWPKNAWSSSTTKLWFHYIWRSGGGTELPSEHGKCFACIWLIELDVDWTVFFSEASILPRKFSRWPKIECWREEGSHAKRKFEQHRPQRSWPRRSRSWPNHSRWSKKQRRPRSGNGLESHIKHKTRWRRQPAIQPQRQTTGPTGQQQPIEFGCSRKWWLRSSLDYYRGMHAKMCTRI